MFGFSLATQIFHGSTQRTWNCVSNFANLVWGKFSHYRQASMPRSRKRHHSRSKSRSRSRSTSRDRSHDRHKKPDSYEKDGKRRRVDEIDSPIQKRSLSSENHDSIDPEVQRIQDVLEKDSNVDDAPTDDVSNEKNTEKSDNCKDNENQTSNESVNENKEQMQETASESDSEDVVFVGGSSNLETESLKQEKIGTSNNPCTPKQPLTPKQLKRRLESEKKRVQKQKEKEERERQKQEEKFKIIAERQKSKQQKEAERLKLIEQKQKEKEDKKKEREEKEEQRKREKEEKELKRKEKEEQEVQKKKEKEMEKLKKQQEIEEKNKEKQKEEIKKHKTSAFFVGFFKKTEGEEREKKIEKVNSNFMPFEVKSDMRLPPLRRNPLTTEDIKTFDFLFQSQDKLASYLSDIKLGVIKPGKTRKTWPYEEPDDEVTIIEEDNMLGETICENTTTKVKTKAKFFYFHENRRPPYFGTWRKKSKVIKPRRPFEEDAVIFNYEEDSDDDWEEEEQGESLDASAGEEDKEADNAEDEYEVDNDFFVPHGHLSDDEIDDEENARLSPESLKQKLKLLKDEFDEDIKSKTRKLKPRSIGCIWFNKKGDNVEEAIQKYLQPFAMIIKGQIEIKKRSEIFVSSPEKKKMKTIQELPPEHIPFFLKIIHGNVNKKRVVIEQFLTYMANNGLNVDVSKANLTRYLKKAASYKRCKEDGPMKNKFGWFVNDDVPTKYNVKLELGAKTEV